MKKLLVILATLFLVACSDVPSGYVGVKVNMLGSDKGVDITELGVGRYWIGWNEKLFTFPTFSQNQVWTRDSTEGSPNDDSMSFQTVEGLSVNTDLGITYAIDPKKVSVIFQKYRKGISEITSVYMRSMVRDALVTEASTRPIESIYGKGKAELIEAVQKRVKDQTESIGIMVEKIYLVGDLRLPESITKSINDKIGATQMTQQRENEVAQSKAEADKKIAEARGIAESALLIANAEAQAIALRGKAISDNPLVIQLNSIEKWNGQLPSTMIPGSSTPFISIK